MKVGRVGDRAWLLYRNAFGRVVAIEGRTVVADIGDVRVTQSYADAVPECAITENTDRVIAFSPYRWEGMPTGAWSCDFVRINKPGVA